MIFWMRSISSATCFSQLGKLENPPSPLIFQLLNRWSLFSHCFVRLPEVYFLSKHLVFVRSMLTSTGSRWLWLKSVTQKTRASYSKTTNCWRTGRLKWGFLYSEKMRNSRKLRPPISRFTWFQAVRSLGLLEPQASSQWTWVDFASDIDIKFTTMWTYVDLSFSILEPSDQWLTSGWGWWVFPCSSKNLPRKEIGGI